MSRCLCTRRVGTPPRRAVRRLSPSSGPPCPRGCGARVDVRPAVDVGDAVGRAASDRRRHEHADLAEVSAPATTARRTPRSSRAGRGTGRPAANPAVEATSLTRPPSRSAPRGAALVEGSRRRGCCCRVRVQESAIAESMVEEIHARESSAEEAVSEEPAVEAAPEELAPVLARTASDPAPMMSFDSTTVMPPLSLLPPLPGLAGRGGRPPVPPSPSRRAGVRRRPSRPAGVVDRRPAPAGRRPFRTTSAALVAPVRLVAGDRDPAARRTADGQPGGARRCPACSTTSRMRAGRRGRAGRPPSLMPRRTEPAGTASPADAPSTPGTVGAQLELRLRRRARRRRSRPTSRQLGTYAALTRASASACRRRPELPNGAGEVLFVVGPGVETLRAARSLAASLRLDPDRVQWATRATWPASRPRAAG